MPSPASPSPASPSHASILSTFGYDGGPWAALLNEHGPPDRHGRVVRADRGAITVATEAGLNRVTLTHNDPHVVTGDWVVLPDGDDPGLAGVAQRTTAISRPAHHRGFRTEDEGGGDQILAANVDLVGVTVPMHDEINVRRLERGLVMAFESGATPVVVLTKSDLLDDDDAAHALEVTRATAMGAEVVVTSATRGAGVDELAEVLRPDRTLVLLGSSGAGKSTVINALVGAAVMATGDVRSVDGKGRHTTTHRELVAVPGGGVVMDTPGLRTLSLGQVGDGLDLAFADVEGFTDGCRFTDCRHEGEPGCGVQAAVDDGRLAADRFEGWSRIRAESENAALRADKAAYRKATRSWGRVHAEAQADRNRKRGG